MIINKSEDVVFFDVDQTLVLHEGPDAGTLEVNDTIRGGKILVVPHEPMIRLLKEAHQRGSHVVVWSRGGWAWAHNVVKALELDKYVHQVMTKPSVYFDDRDIKEWLPYRVYIQPGETYKTEV